MKSPSAPASRMLRGVLWASATAGGLSAALFLTLFLAPVLPMAVAWAMAFLVVFLAMLAIGMLAWTILTLPQGAPMRVLGLRVCAGVLGAATLALLFGLGALGWHPPALSGAALALVSVMLAREA